MNGRRTAVLAALVVALLGPAAGALEVGSGLAKLALREGTGRFTLAVLTDPAKNTWTPLLTANDPRTSTLSLLVGNRIVRLGDASEFREEVERTASGARFIWTSPQLVVTESFSFLAPRGSALASGVRIDLEIRNVSAQELAVGVRFLFDTWLGEAAGVHFRTDTMVEVTRELLLSKEERPGYWLSPAGTDPGGLGLQGILSGEGITTPDRVVFANWKRLSDAAWSYEVSPNRNFSMLPFSVNDSAVCQYYDPVALARGASTTITLALGRASGAGYSLLPSPATDLTGSVREALAVSSSVQDKEFAARTDLATLNLLLAEIDRRIAAGADPTAEELALFEQAVAALRERSARYGK